LHDSVVSASRVVVAADGQFREPSQLGSAERVFKEAFENAGLPIFNPHSFARHWLSLGREMRTIEEMKAWSQNSATRNDDDVRLIWDAEPEPAGGHHGAFAR